eukprot:2132335-Pyramimonas_sp.AAC.1
MTARCSKCTEDKSITEPRAPNAYTQGRVCLRAATGPPPKTLNLRRARRPRPSELECRGPDAARAARE